MTVKEFKKPSNGEITLVRVLKAVGDVIKQNTRTPVESTCTSLIIPANKPVGLRDIARRAWSKDDEHRKTLES